MKTIPKGFEAFLKYPQFVFYRIYPSSLRLGKTDKVPIDVKTGKKLKWSDPKNWIGLDVAVAIFISNPTIADGIGFVFTEHDPFWFLDIDNCLSEGQWTSLALDLCRLFQGAAIEVSNSGKGLHIIGQGKIAPHICKNDLGLEFYNEKRFVALTGNNLIGSVDGDYTEQVNWLINTYFKAPVIDTKSEWTMQACSNVIQDDDALINKALQVKSPQAIFGDKASFFDLWTGNVEKFTVAFPDKFRDRAYDESSVDAALAQHLAFWTGNDCERMLRLMWKSKLVRDKWNRDDYLRITILTACGRQKEWYSEPVKTLIITDPTVDNSVYRAQIKSRIGSNFATLEEQVEIFKDCVYIADDHKILVPGGDLLRPEQFNALYGGRVFILDSTNTKTTKNAWEVFTQSQGKEFKKTQGSCFRPDKAPGEIINDNGRLLANIWWPIKTPRMKGDPTPFVHHIQRLVPDKRDQLILICYLAALLQYKGVKFQWCPVIQGMQGNGKTLFSLCIAFAIGSQHSFLTTAKDIVSPFNGFLYKKLFIGIEDILIPEMTHAEVMEKMKPMITSNRLSIRDLYQPSIERDLCCNFILNTNHKDALRLTRDDRRFASFYTAQQMPGDLQKHGLTGEYFSNLYSWLKLKNGFAIVSEFLHAYEIDPLFNPANLNPAPVTSSSEEAIHYGLGGIEQEIIEAIDQERIGFRGGWISSKALNELLKELHANRRIPLNKRRDILLQLGYDWHPALQDGRVNNEVLPDGGKPRLFIKTDHELCQLDSPQEVALQYSKAQNKS